MAHVHTSEPALASAHHHRRRALGAHGSGERTPAHPDPSAFQFRYAQHARLRTGADRAMARCRAARTAHRTLRPRSGTGARSPAGTPRAMNPSLLSVSDLHFAHKAEQEVLDGVDLDLSEGDVLVIVGPSGC